MKTPGVIALTLLFSTLFAVAPLVATAGTTSKVPCFYYTENNKIIGPTTGVCNANANDIAVVFTKTSTAKVACTIQFSVAGKLVKPISPCPTKANDVEVYWTATTAGPVISKCYWTLNGKAIAACTVPKGATDFTFKAYKVTEVYWTVNGKITGKPLKPPTGTNDVEFLFK